MIPPGQSKLLLRDKAMKAIEKDTNIPAFSGTAEKLMSLAGKENVGMQEIADVVLLDPSLSTKYLRLANSAAFGGRPLKSVQEALVRLGIQEVRKMANAIGVIDRFSRLKTKVDWSTFWLHNLMVARLTECLAHSYFESTGREYLAGLMHDVGKIFLEHYFPQEFEAGLQRAMERRCGVYAAELQLFDTNHAEIGWAVCEKLNVNPEIGRSIRFHHEPNSPFNKDNVDPERQHFLATCINVADLLTIYCNVTLPGAKTIEGDFSNSEEWKLLEKYTPRQELDLNMELELQKARDTLASLHSA